MAGTRKRAASIASREGPVQTMKRAYSGVRRSDRRKRMDMSSIQSIYRPPSPKSASDFRPDPVLPPAKPCTQTTGRKRKRKRDQHLDRLTRLDSSCKKDRLDGKTSPLRTTTKHTQKDPGFDWEDIFEQWPWATSEHHPRMSEPRTNKRSRSQTSYSQSVRDGDSPAAWTQQHEENMKQAGLTMSDFEQRATITKDCEELCTNLRNNRISLPNGPFFKKGRFAQVLERVQYRNEARVVRDILPIVVPSPELLTVNGHEGLEDLGEAIDAEWTRCDTLCGPRPKPDLAIGIRPSAFTKEEIEKLKLSHTSACPNLFPESLYFPFLICEVKADRSIQEAERQAMHSASIAVRAVVNLYKKVSMANEIERRILVFSVAHDNSNVEMYGHFAKFDGHKIEFFRHRLYSGKFAADLSIKKWTEAYQITRAIYDIFYPIHRDRIKLALSKMRDPIIASVASRFGVSEDSQSPTQESEEGQFKKPPLPSTAKLQQENEKLRDELLQVVRNSQAEANQQREEQRENRAILEQQLAQQKEQMERQLAQQKEESQEQKQMMERQLAQQKEESREQKLMMEQQLAQQKEQMERQSAQQKEELRQQKEMMERQLAQQKEQMERQSAQQREQMDRLIQILGSKDKVS